jgi:hypothetical protein
MALSGFSRIIAASAESAAMQKKSIVRLADAQRAESCWTLLVLLGWMPGSPVPDGVFLRDLEEQELQQSSWRDSNPRPRAYKAHALAAELQEEVSTLRHIPSMSRIMASSFRLGYDSPARSCEALLDI